jgi:hypothetical protein
VLGESLIANAFRSRFGLEPRPAQQNGNVRIPGNNPLIGRLPWLRLLLGTSVVVAAEQPLQRPNIVFVLLLFTVIGGLVPAAIAQQGRTRADAIARQYPALPDTVERRPVTIWSDGTKMAGDLYLPAGLGSEARLPLIVFIAGEALRCTESLANPKQERPS